MHWLRIWSSNSSLAWGGESLVLAKPMVHSLELDTMKNYKPALISLISRTPMHAGTYSLALRSCNKTSSMFIVTTKNGSTPKASALSG